MTTLQIRTENSVYELTTSEIRRVTGSRPATECFDPNGEWKTFAAISMLAVGKQPAVWWTTDAPHDLTILSRVTDIQEL